jgi:hypothetical protein
MKWGTNRFQTQRACDSILWGGVHATWETPHCREEGTVQISQKCMQLLQWGNHFINNSVTQKGPVGSFFEKLTDTKANNRFRVRSEILWEVTMKIIFFRDVTPCT